MKSKELIKKMNQRRLRAISLEAGLEKCLNIAIQMNNFSMDVFILIDYMYNWKETHSRNSILVAKFSSFFFLF